MAKGVLHLNVEFSAVADEEGKFGRLATLLGLADADHARGKCEHLWVACTRRGEAELPQWLVEQVLGERGPDALIEAELAGWAGGRGDSKTRRIRIGGAAKHCLWMASDQAAKHEQSSKGGKTRAANASRAGGRFTSDHQPELPAQTSPSEISSASDLPEDQNLSLSLAIPQAVPEPPPIPAVSPPAPAREDIARTQLVAGDQLKASKSTAPSQITRTYGDQQLVANYDPADPFARGRLAETTWHRVSDAAIAIAVDLKLPRPLPFPAITPGSMRAGYRDLSERIREEGELAPIACDRVVENLVKQARSKRSIEWLAEKVFGDKAWVNARNGIDPSARPQVNRHDPQPAPPRPRDRDPPPKVIPSEELAGPAQFAEARDFLARALTSNDDDTPNPDEKRKPRKARSA